MPIRIATATVPFKDEDGKPIPDASYTIRQRLSHEGQLRYVDALTSVSLDPESGEPSTAAQRIRLREISEILLADALLGWTGVEDAQGNPVPIERALSVDDFYVGQVVREIQTRNAPKKAEGPKGDAPTASS